MGKEKIEDDLKNLCSLFIKIMDAYLDRGLISQEEYITLTKLKRDFLEGKF